MDGPYKNLDPILDLSVPSDGYAFLPPGAAGSRNVALPLTPAKGEADLPSCLQSVTAIPTTELRAARVREEREIAKDRIKRLNFLQSDDDVAEDPKVLKKDTPDRIVPGNSKDGSPIVEKRSHYSAAFQDKVHLNSSPIKSASKQKKNADIGMAKTASKPNVVSENLTIKTQPRHARENRTKHGDRAASSIPERVTAKECIKSQPVKTLPCSEKTYESTAAAASGHRRFGGSRPREVSPRRSFERSNAKSRGCEADKKEISCRGSTSYSSGVSKQECSKRFRMMRNSTLSSCSDFYQSEKEDKLYGKSVIAKGGLLRDTQKKGSEPSLEMELIPMLLVAGTVFGYIGLMAGIVGCAIHFVRDRREGKGDPSRRRKHSKLYSVLVI